MRRALVTLALLAATLQHANAQQVTVTGLLLDHHYRPAAGVTIAHVIGKADAAGLAAALAAPLTKSDDDGTFRAVVTLDPKRWNGLLVGGGKFALQQRTISAIGTQLELDTVTLAPGHTLAGRVLDAGGNPLAGAEVTSSEQLLRLDLARFHEMRTQWRLTSTASTDERGYFRMAGAPLSGFAINVACDGYYDSPLRAVAADQPIEVTLEPARVVRGRVVDEWGEPIAGVPVRADFSTTTSGEDGAFVLALRSEDTSRMIASPPRELGKGRAVAKVPVDDTPVVLQLTNDPEGIRGSRVRAVDATGEAIVDFEVYVQWIREQPVSRTTLQQLLGDAARRPGCHTTARDGEAALPEMFSLGDVGLVFVRAPGHGWGLERIGRAQRARGEIVVTLPPARAVTGKVVDREGQPLAGVIVVPGPPVTAVNAEALAMYPELSQRIAAGPDAVITDAAGAFHLVDLPPDELCLMLLAPGGGLLIEPDPLDLRDAPPAQPLTLRATAPTTLRGSFAAPMPLGTRVRLGPKRIGALDSVLQAVDDGTPSVPVAADGSFAFVGVAPRTWRPELVLPPPPRLGASVAVDFVGWPQGGPFDAPLAAKVPPIVKLTGKVAGELPWHRLAVATMPLDTISDSDDWMVRGPLCALDPDRSFSLLTPATPTRVVLFDAATGIPLEFSNLTAAALAEPIELRGDATRLGLLLRGEPPAGDPDVFLYYSPTLERWPNVRPGSKEQVTAHLRAQSTRWSLGDDVTLWLPARDGQLALRTRTANATCDIAQLRDTTATLEITFDPTGKQATVRELDR